MVMKTWQSFLMAIITQDRVLISPINTSALNTLHRVTIVAVNNDSLIL